MEEKPRNFHCVTVCVSTKSIRVSGLFHSAQRLMHKGNGNIRTVAVSTVRTVL